MNIVDVLRVISERDDLVSGSRHGIRPFSKYCNNNDGDALYYDDSHPTCGADGSVRYDIIQNCLVDNLHHDIISRYGTVNDEYKVTISAVKFEDEDDFEVEMIIESYKNTGSERSDITYYISNGQYSVC